ncbi:MAG: type secretion system protein [Caulobacteraceae bacterium]|nr:type secretion system protein [Caulobacteraceae bacterium]
MDHTTLMVGLAAVLAFIAVAGLGFAIAGGDSGQARTVKRAQAMVQGSGGRAAKIERLARAKAAVNSPDSRRKQILKTLKEQERQARKATVTLEARIRQAGLVLTIQNFWIISAASGLGVAALAFFLKHNLWLALGVMVVAGAGLPRWVIGFLAKRRTKKFTEAFSDAIDIIVRGIKSGLPVHDCLKIIGRESPEPLGSEFVRLVENIGMGMSVDQALEQMYSRMPTPELRFFTIVMAIQQKTGGNLAEALGNLSQVLRSRKLMREKIKALSSEAVASSFIIGSLPPAVVLLISISSPSYMAIMFSDPRGHLIMLVGVFWMAVGIFVMRKMINFKF